MSWLFPPSREMEREREIEISSLSQSQEIEHKHPKCNYANNAPQNLLKYSSLRRSGT